VSVKPVAPAAGWGGHPNRTGSTGGCHTRRQISGFPNPLGFAYDAMPDGEGTPYPSHDVPAMLACLAVIRANRAAQPR
jgi:hypothetical protein